MPSESLRPSPLGGTFYIMDSVAPSKTANLTSTKASSWLERMWIIRSPSSLQPCHYLCLFFDIGRHLRPSFLSC